MITLISWLLDYRFWITVVLSFILAKALIIAAPILSDKPLYLLALPLAALFFTILVIKPKWILVVLIIFRPLLDNILNLSKVGVGDGQGIGIGAILNLAIIILVIFLTFYSGNFPRGNKVVRYWSIFLFLMFIVLFYSPYKFGAIRLYFNYLSYFAMFLIPFLVIKNKEDFLFWLKILAVSFVLPVLFADLDLMRGGHYYTDAGIRIEGTFSHPNILAFYLVLGLTVYFYILKCQYWKLNSKIIWGIRILMLNMLILLVATKTRNAWFACISIFFVYGLLKDRKLLIILFLILPLSLLVPQVQDRVLTVLHGKESNNYQGLNSYQWRLRVWASSWPLIVQKPLQGYGLTSFNPMSGQFSDVGRNVDTHNTYLEMLFETGIIGLLSFLSLFISPLIIFFKNMINASNKIHAKLWAIVFAYVISYMIICSADNLLYYLVFNWYVWFFIGLMLVSERFCHD